MLAHWGHRQNFFSMSVSTKEKLDECIKQERQHVRTALAFWCRIPLNLAVLSASNSEHAAASRTPHKGAQTAASAHAQLNNV